MNPDDEEKRHAMGNFDLREPSIDAYIAGLNAADRRWAEEAAEIARSNEIVAGSFNEYDAVIGFGTIIIVGSGDYEGWKVSRHERDTQHDGYHITTPPTEGQRRGFTVGFVAVNRDGTWTACHDPYNHRPGIKLGSTGTRVKVSTQEAAYRYIVVRQTRHETKSQR